MTTRRKIFYLQHVDWKWIKQRPHFLAENLSIYYKVFLFYSFSINRSGLVKNNGNLIRWMFPLLPFPFRFGNLIYLITKKLNFLFLNTFIILLNPEIIWVTHPKMFDLLSKSNKKRLLIYDCMDDILEFSNNEFEKNYLFKLEKELIHSSRLIFCSSENLVRKVKERYKGKDTKFYLIRNGMKEIQNSNLEKNQSCKIIINQKINLCYFGTIEEWFDYEKVEKILKKFNNVHLHLIGPYNKKYFNSDNVTYYGPVNHTELMENLYKYDAFIMPFVINDLILSVDPVKLYEYLFSNKPVISIYYPEVERFKKYIYFYETYEQLEELIHLLSNKKLSSKQNNDEIEKFLEQNTWRIRGREINEIIEKQIIRESFR